METIAAVLVTYNRIADLKICLDSLRRQTRPLNRIFVINNGSTDGTAEWLATQTDLAVTTQANLGGAGGFATGIQTGYERRLHLALVHGRRLRGRARRAGPAAGLAQPGAVHQERHVGERQ
ncbi:MAG: glycosyltransferase [Hymenobacter sp.]